MPDGRWRRPAIAAKSLLRFLTCGSVDDGKSTLIGRLLYDADLIMGDQLAALKAGIRGALARPATISISRCSWMGSKTNASSASPSMSPTVFLQRTRALFIVADSPGHEQYTRNMATGASTADLAVLLVDARKGVLAQTRRHSLICSLFGIRHIVLAVNKLDLVGFERAVFDRIAADYARFAADSGLCLADDDPAIGALRRQSDRALGAHALVRGAEPPRLPREHRRGRGHKGINPCGFRCNGSTARIASSADFPGPWRRDRWRRATRFW